MPKPRRAASPAYSENEVDIAGSLFANDADSDSDNGRDVDNGKKMAATADALDFGDLLNAADGDSDDADGDAAFIARQQRSSNRKTGNLQSKSAKKGGGFQVMGESLSLPAPTLSLHTQAHATHVSRPQFEPPESY